MKILKPYRAKIDQIDEELIALFKKRFAIIDEVGHLKSKENIPAVLQDRVDEVRENAVSMAGDEIDGAFIRQLWADIIAYSCEREEIIKDSYSDTAKQAS